MRDAMKVRGGASPPRYRLIMDSLQDYIVSGRYMVGSALPTENELCAKFGVSRYTVREALRRLADLGLVARRQGSGTQVIASTPKSSYAHRVQSLSELCELGGNVRFEVEAIAHADLDGPEAASIGAEPGSRWARVDGIIKPDDGTAALCHARMYLPERFAHLAERLQGSCEIHALIEEHAGEISEVIQHIGSEPMPPVAARSLGQADNSWSIRFTRQYLDGRGEILLAILSWHPAGSVSYTTRLRRNGHRTD